MSLWEGLMTYQPPAGAPGVTLDTSRSSTGEAEAKEPVIKFWVYHTSHHEFSETSTGT